MPLELFYRDNNNQEKNIKISVVLRDDIENIVNLSKHSCETSKTFIDNISQELKTISLTIFLPAQERIVDSESDRIPISNPPTLNVFDVYLYEKSFIRPEVRRKQDVYDLLKSLQENGVVFDYLYINGRTYKQYCIQSIKFSEDNNTGDGWDIDLVFQETMFVSSRQVIVPDNILKLLKSLSSESVSDENQEKIINNNKITKQNQVGDTNTETFKDAISENPAIKRAFERGEMSPTITDPVTGETVTNPNFNTQLADLFQEKMQDAAKRRGTTYENIGIDKSKRKTSDSI